MSHRWGAGTAPSLEHVTETLRVQVLAGAAGAFSPPGSTFFADSYFGICSTATHVTTVICIKPVFNWVHICFLNVVWVICRT